MGGDWVARKRWREREREWGGGQKRVREEKREERRVACKRSSSARNGCKVLSARQNARPAPLKQELFRMSTTVKLL